ncbi:VanZ family protein [Candidatus Woesebacteria bacterium]|nr:VanZ family protein [Candidatus Woesebacteria bacterium]
MDTLSKLFSRLPRYVWIMLSVAWMTFIFFLSSRQRIAVSEQYWTNFMVFKSLHVIEYAILSMLNTMALIKNTNGITMKTAALYGAILALVYAISDETHQSFVPTRTGQPQDVLIDSIGIFSVYWFITQYEKNKKGPTTPLRPRTP